MNIIFFLTPKKDVEYVESDFTIRQVVEKMEYHHYTAVPIIDTQGKYVDVISADDILFTLKNYHFNWEKAMKVNILTIKPYRSIEALTIDKDINDLLKIISNQNFVPVVDDNNYFIGIITRQSVLKYLKQQLNDYQKYQSSN